MISCIEDALDEIDSLGDDAHVILAGDFNQLLLAKILVRQLSIEFEGLSHEGQPLDRIYASGQFYSFTAVRSIIKTKHLAIIATSVMVANGANIQTNPGKTTDQFHLRIPDNLQKYLVDLSRDFITESTSLPLHLKISLHLWQQSATHSFQLKPYNEDKVHDAANKAPPEKMKQTVQIGAYRGHLSLSSEDK